MRILLVDDEPIIIQSIGKFLIEIGHDVAYANDGVNALALLDEDEGFDLIVSDIRMPRIDGLEFLRLARLRSPAVPVLLMTGFGDEGTVLEAFHQGACDYMKKPIKLGDLLACIKRLEMQKRFEADILANDSHNDRNRSSISKLKG